MLLQQYQNFEQIVSDFKQGKLNLPFEYEYVIEEIISNNRFNTL